MSLSTKAHVFHCRQYSLVEMITVYPSLTTHAFKKRNGLSCLNFNVSQISMLFSRKFHILGQSSFKCLESLSPRSSSLPIKFNYSSSTLPLTIKSILKKSPSSSPVTVFGWIKTVRIQKKIAFAELTDGSQYPGLQLVFLQPSLAKRYILLNGYIISYG